MKKWLVIGCLILLAFSAASILRAEEFYLNFGWLNDNHFTWYPFIWYLGGSLDLQLGRYFFLSPEVNLATYKLKFRDFLFNPGVMFNARIGSFFLGGGLSKFFRLAGTVEVGQSNILLKLNAGWQGSASQVRIFVQFPFSDPFQTWTFGMQSGVSF